MHLENLHAQKTWCILKLESNINDINIMKPAKFKPRQNECSIAQMSNRTVSHATNVNNIPRIHYMKRFNAKSFNKYQFGSNKITLKGFLSLYSQQNIKVWRIQELRCSHAHINTIYCAHWSVNFSSLTWAYVFAAALPRDFSWRQKEVNSTVSPPS